MIWISILIPVVIAFANIYISISVIKKNIKKPFSQFNKIFFTAFLVRFFSVIILLALILIFTDIDKFVFALTFIISVFLSIIIEIFYLNIKKNLINLHK